MRVNPEEQMRLWVHTSHSGHGILCSRLSGCEIFFHHFFFFSGAFFAVAVSTAPFAID